MLALGELNDQHIATIINRSFRRAGHEESGRKTGSDDQWKEKCEEEQRMNN